MKTSILTYLDQAVEKNPEKIAFTDGKIQLSFRALQEFSHKIASFLLTQQITKSPILIFMEKSPTMVASFFGVLASGNFYVPLDTQQPPSRLLEITKTVNSSVVLVDKVSEEKALNIWDKSQILLLSDLEESPILQDKLQEIREKSLDIDPIYVVFTSGTTGEPKGIVANHRCVIDYVEQLQKVLQTTESTIFGSQSPLFVDACLKEILLTLKNTATTYFIPKSLFLFPIKLIDYLNQYQINTVCWVSTAFTIVSSLGGLRAKKIEYLHTIAFGSEVFPLKQLKLWREHLPQATFIHLYGPTEATGMSTFYKLPPNLSEEEGIPIGKPFPNTEIILLDEEKNRITEPETTGEIAIRGTCLSLGYYNHRQRSQEVFIQHPEVTAYPDLIYLTGDLAQYNIEGNLLFMGRKDQQIKHLGYRIELGDIEETASNISGVQLVSSVYKVEKKQILLYYTGEITESQLKYQLSTLLPPYMNPQDVIQLEEMPRTPNGKVDRNKLKDLKIT